MPLCSWAHGKKNWKSVHCISRCVMIAAYTDIWQRISLQMFSKSVRSVNLTYNRLIANKPRLVRLAGEAMIEID